MSKKIVVSLVAYTRVEWSGVVEVPDDATRKEIDDIAQQVELHVDGGDYMDDNEYWEQGETRWEKFEDDGPASIVVTFDEDGGIELEEVEDE